VLGTLLVLLGAALVAAWLALSALTFAGDLRRGQRWYLALVAGLFFPVTWVVWYLIDAPSRHQGDEASRSREAAGRSQ
jgi:hypothetical protein